MGCEQLLGKIPREKTDDMVILLHKPHTCLRLAQGRKLCALCLREFHGCNGGTGRRDLGTKVWVNALCEEFK